MKATQLNRILIILLIIEVIFLLSVLCAFLFIMYNTAFKIPRQTEITYKDLTFEEIEFIRNNTSDLKLYYLIYVNKITYVKDISSYCPDCLGQNKWGYIVVEYSDNRKLLRQVLCHEIGHTWIAFKPSEQIVHDIFDSEVCYGN